MSDVLLPEAETIAAICRAHHVHHLDLFGSVSSGTSRPNSDVDLLYTIDVPPGASYLVAIGGLQSDLEAAFGRNVDLVRDGEFKNPYFRAEVERHRRRLYP